MLEKRSAPQEHANRVREMFGRIAGRYDLLNHLLSGNVDKRWRQVVAERVREGMSGEALILDVACGTGDLSLSLFESTGARVIGTDFCRPMLSLAAGKLPRQIPLVEGDALSLPFKEGTFDVVTIAFGLRNLSDISSGLRELRRILKPKGRVAVLEFSRPSNSVLRMLFGIYFRNLLPLLGGIISGSRSAYIYLPSSVAQFPDQQQLAGLIEQAGFDRVSYENLTGGIAALHLGRRPE
ncbi:MAG TPA: bifunctional demethylmenaquinone methyltransferase/2-methoxy-6-polyprenyl-1,4-benzoquinol methylase UbiE [Pyrinomonadaceae bacterium]